MIPLGLRCASILFLLIASTLDLPAAEIHFENFTSVQGLALLGSAAVSGNALRLTPAKRNKAGAVWFREKQPVQKGFESTFRFQLTQQSRICQGADGFAFVMQNSGPGAVGGRGSAGGFGVPAWINKGSAGIPWSIAVFFDTCQNAGEGDPSGNYVALRINGRPDQMRWPTDRLAFTQNLSIPLKDRKIHTARIRFEPPVMAVFLDALVAPILQAAVDLSLVADQEGKAWLGFTASTGWGSENHDILDWSFQEVAVSSGISTVSSDISFPMSECLPNHNLCTPERAFVERKGLSYHVVLPGNLEWGVKVPNPSGGVVEISNAHGVVCWDVKTLGTHGCSGPSEALIHRTRDGFTWFSVNGHSGTAFSNNDGFYEFDVEVK